MLKYFPLLKIAGNVRKTFTNFVAGTGIALDVDGENVTIRNSGTGGDVAGPVSATDSTVALFDGITGKLLKDSGILLSAKVTGNIAITGATKTKVTYDSKGLVTAGADATTADIAASTDKNYVTDAQKTVIENTSGTNSGNETTTTVGTLINGATEKTTPVDADFVGLMDSAASNILKKLSWANIKATLKTYLDTLYQPLDADLTTIAGLTATTDNIIQSTGSAWASRTPSQVKTALSLNNLDNTSDANKPVSTAQQTALDLKANLASPTFTGTPAAPTAAAATNTTQLATTAHVFAERTNSYTMTNKTLTSPVINTPTGIVKGDVGLGNVDNTSNATERAATATLSSKRITKRVVATTQSATPAINTDVTDVSHITGLAQAVTSFTSSLTGTPVNGDSLIISITDNGTARGITWGDSFESSGNVTLPTTTVISTRLDVGLLWNTVTSKWRCVAVA